MGRLSDEVRSIQWAFGTGDERREKVLMLAKLVDAVEEAAEVADELANIGAICKCRDLPKGDHCYWCQIRSAVARARGAGWEKRHG